MKHTCKLVALLMALALCLAAPAFAETADISSLKVGVVMKSNDSFQQKVMRGAEDAVAALGLASCDCIAPNSENELQEQAQMVDNMITRGVDILLVAPDNPDALTGVFDRAVEEGIILIMVDNDAENYEHKLTYVGLANYDAAYNGIKPFCAQLGEGANVVVIRGTLGNTNHNDRLSGFETAFAEEGINMLDIQAADSDTAKAEQVMSDMITKYVNNGTQIDAVICTDDLMAAGAISAIANADLTGRIKVTGFAGFQNVIDMIGSGECDLIIAMQPYQMGYQGVEAAVACLNGEEVPAFIDTGIVNLDSSNWDTFEGC